MIVSHPPEPSTQSATKTGPAHLTEVEQTLADSLVTGERVDLRKMCQPGVLVMGHAPIRSSVVRSFICGQMVPESDVDPHGLTVIGAILDTRLDLEDITYTKPLIFSDCIFTYGLDASRATFHLLGIVNADLSSSGGPALAADKLTVESDLELSGAYSGAGDLGAVRLMGARIGGQLRCHAQLASPDGPALAADGLAAGGGLYLDGTYNGSGELGAVRLLGAHVGGQLRIATTVTNGSGPALSADNLTVDSNLLLDGTYNGAGKLGVIRVAETHIGGQLRFRIATTVTNGSGPALSADNLTVGSNLELSGSYKGMGDDGVVRLVGAQIGGQIRCHAQIASPGGPALAADGLAAGGGFYLDGTYNGSGELGAVRLLGAHVGGQLRIASTLTNGSGPALSADNVNVDSNFFLSGTCKGAGEAGVVRLPAAHVGGQVQCTAALSSPAGPALAADNLIVDTDLILHGAFEGPQRDGVMRLVGAHVGGALLLATTMERTRWLVLDGLTYTGIPRTGSGVEYSVDAWIALLKDHTTAYAAQPWQQAATVWRATGHDDQARRILIAQQDDRHDRVLPKTRHRLWAKILSRLSKHLTGYGYQSWRSAVYLVALTTISFAISIIFGDPSCGSTEWAQTGLAWAVPVIFAGIDATCVPTHLWLTIVSWIIHVLGWILVTLLVAGFSGIIRKSHN